MISLNVQTKCNDEMSFNSTSIMLNIPWFSIGIEDFSFLSLPTVGVCVCVCIVYVKMVSRKCRKIFLNIFIARFSIQPEIE